MEFLLADLFELSESDWYGVNLSAMVDAEHGPRHRKSHRRGKVAIVSGASGIQVAFRPQYEFACSGSF